jgi:ligand-binding sensor domain-containing protein/signal transduction histidine kinase
MAIDSGCSTEKVAMSSIPSIVRILAVDDHPQLREDLVPPHAKRVSERSQKRRSVLNSLSIRVSLSLAFSLIGAAVCHAKVPEAPVNPVPLELPVDYATDIRFAQISTAEGLSQIKVMNIVQDDLGFMWFGTLAGLNRFDGYTFKVFVHERDNPNSPSGVDIESLFKDRDGALWIGSEQALDRFDPKTETFIHFPVPMVKKISQDRAGLLWFSTDRGLYRLDQRSGKFRVYTHDASDPESLPDNHVVSAAEDKTGRFWVGEPDGMYEFDRASGHVKLSIPLHNASRDFSFYEDRSGGFWIIYGTGNGLAKFDRERNVITYYSFHAKDTSSTAFSGVTAMLEDRHGNLWLATQGLGLVKFDREHSRFISYTYKPGDSDGLAEDRVTTLFEDRDGSIWVALFGRGLQRFSPVPAAFQPVGLTPKEDGIGCFYEDSHRNLWIGTRLALHRIDPSGKSTAFVGVKPGVPFDVISVVEDPAGLIWVGTNNNGLFRLDPKNGQWKNYRHNENDPSSLSNNLVDRLLVDSEGTLWAATWNGIDRFDARTDRFTTFSADPHAREMIYLAMAEGTQHDLWLGTYGFGLQHFNPKTTQFTTIGSSDALGSLSDSEVNWVHVARTGSVWVATSNGLNEYDPTTKHFTVYDVRDGLASSAVDCVLEDTRGKLWMNTTRGISSFDPPTRTFRNFSTAEGLPGPEMAGVGACLHSRSGRMYFAGFSGATTFIPEAIPEANYAPPTLITDFRLLGNSHSPTLKIAPQAISYASEIILSHKQTPFSLTFAAFAYSNPATNRYRYMLEGLDNSWTEVGSDGRTVTYTALPARKYRFRVQGATNSSQWSEPGAELEIIILPPWWNTWWFRTAYALAALLIIWSVYSYRMRQIAEQVNIRIDAQVNERMRIARDLHDTLLQSFQGAAFQFQAARKLLLRNAGNAMQVVDEAIHAAEEGITEGRAAIRDLRPEPAAQRNLPELLNAACRELATGQELNGNAPSYQVLVEGKQQNLSPMLQDEVYRISREVVRNAFAHAAASHIEVEIRYEYGQLRVRIRDDGNGIDPKILEAGGTSGHFGIPGMRERAQRIGSRLNFWSEMGAGTEVQLTIPAAMAYEKRRHNRRFLLFHRAGSDE